VARTEGANGQDAYSYHFTTDAQGRLQRQLTANGEVVFYTRNAQGQETQRATFRAPFLAHTTPPPLSQAVSVVSTQWHATFNLPIQVNIDHFKKLNDEHGHLAGDEMLRRVATVLGSTARPADVVCRYGGEEFLLLMMGVDLPTAVAHAESLREQAQAMHTPWGKDSLQVTVSLGVACSIGHGDTPDTLSNAADQALYRAKGLGRNRVVAADRHTPANHRHHFFHA
jgi:diguanylate cyclase (GGDEF)-like protein